MTRDVTKFKFKFNNVLTSNVFNRFKILKDSEKLIHMHSQPESAEKLFFSNSTYHTNYSY